MTLDRSGETAPLRAPDDFDGIAVSELVNQHLIADAGCVFRVLKSELFQDACRRNAPAGLLEMPAHGLVDVLQLDGSVFDEPQLHGVVAVAPGGRFFLNDDTRPGLD